MIFADKELFKALSDKNNPNHDESIKIQNFLANSNESTVINTTVITETLNKVKGSPQDVKETYDNLCNENTVISLTDKDYSKSLEINKWFSNSINYNDCTIIKTMMDLEISRIITFNTDFEKIGYEVISSWEMLKYGY